MNNVENYIGKVHLLKKVVSVSRKIRKYNATLTSAVRIRLNGVSSHITLVMIFLAPLRLLRTSGTLFIKMYRCKLYLVLHHMKQNVNFGLYRK